MNHRACGLCKLHLKRYCRHTLTKIIEDYLGPFIFRIALAGNILRMRDEFTLSARPISSEDAPIFKRKSTKSLLMPSVSLNLAGVIRNLVRASPDGKMGWMIVRVKIAYTKTDSAGKKTSEQTVMAWMSAYGTKSLSRDLRLPTSQRHPTAERRMLRE